MTDRPPANNRFNPEVAALLSDSHPAEMAVEVLRLRAELEAHRDAQAVRRFARLMTTKLAASRHKGRSGWQTCPVEVLWTMLREHVGKGDPVDVAVLAMMILHNTETHHAE